MSLEAFNPVIVNTIVARLTGLFVVGARGDMEAASSAAWEMLESYQPQTRDELILAADIIGHSFHNLDLIGQAANPQMPLVRMTRILSAATAQHREACKSRRLLALSQRPEKPVNAKSQKATKDDVVAPPGAPAATPPKTSAPDKTATPIDFIRDVMAFVSQVPPRQPAPDGTAIPVTAGRDGESIEQDAAGMAAAFDSIHRPAMNGAAPG